MDPEAPAYADDQRRYAEIGERAVAVLLAGIELSLSGRKPGRFRAAARAVIAAKRLSTVDSDPSGSRKED